MKCVKISEDGQVNIPQHIQKKYGFLPQSEVSFVEENGAVYLKKVQPAESSRKDSIARMRKRATVQVSTEQIMKLTRGEPG